MKKRNKPKVVYTQKLAKNYDFIEVVRRDFVNGRVGKADALNAGLKHAAGEIIFCFDADYYPQLDILEKLGLLASMTLK